MGSSGMGNPIKKIFKGAKGVLGGLQEGVPGGGIIDIKSEGSGAQTPGPDRSAEVSARVRADEDLRRARLLQQPVQEEEDLIERRKQLLGQ